MTSHAHHTLWYICYPLLTNQFSLSLSGLAYVFSLRLQRNILHHQQFLERCTERNSSCRGPGISDLQKSGANLI